MLLSDIADQYWLPSVRSASSRFHSAIRRHQFASVRQADSRLSDKARPPQPSTRVDLATQWATSCWLTVVVQRPAASLCRARTSSLSRGCSAARPTCMATPAAVVTRSGAHRLAPGTTHAACATTPPVGLTSVRRATKARSAYKHVSHLRHCLCRSLYRSTCEYPSTAAGTPCVCPGGTEG